MKFERATKTQSRLRMALIGPSGSGKTYSALSIAKHLGSRIAVIDTERGSASKYADEFEFDCLELATFAPQNFIEAIQAADAAGYDVLVIDSLSHAWIGKGGSLEQHDKEVDKQKVKNSFTAWREVTKNHSALIDAILQSRCHVIGTMRSKTAHVQEEENGRKVVRKIGMEAIQRDGMEYEFDVVGDLDWSHKLTISKTRCRKLDGEVIEKPGREIAEVLKRWLSDGAADTTEQERADVLSQLHEIFTSQGKTNDEWVDYAAKSLKALSLPALRERLAEWMKAAEQRKEKTAHA